MPRPGFGFPLLRDDLGRLAGFLQAGNETQAEILSQQLIEDLRRAGIVPPAYEGHLPGAFPGAETYNDVAVYMHTCLVNIKKHRLDRAEVNVRNAHRIFRASFWYPKDDPLSAAAAKGV
jgi:hypothetical protein